MNNQNEFGRKVSGAATGADATSEAPAGFAKQAARLRREVPIIKVVSEYTTLRGSRRLVGNCPLHEWPNRMLRVYPRTNMFRCLFCGAEGDAIEFLEQVAGLTYGQALEALENILYSDEHSDAA